MNSTSPKCKVLLSDSGFAIRREFVAFRDEGVLHTFGRMAGRWNVEQNGVEYTALGKGMKSLLPVSLTGHMLCYVVTKK